MYRPPVDFDRRDEAMSSPESPSAYPHRFHTIKLSIKFVGEDDPVLPQFAPSIVYNILFEHIFHSTRVYAHSYGQTKNKITPIYRVLR